MNQHNHHGTENPGAVNNDAHCDRCSKERNFTACLIGASVLVGAILISGSVFFNTRIVLKRLDGGAALTAGTVAANNQPSQPNPSPSQPAAPTGPVDVKLKPNTPFLGKADAKVTVVEFADYQCPFCEKWYTSNMQNLKSQYIDTGKVKFVYQDFAFLGSDSNTLAEGSHCAADQGKFWQYHDYLFTHQGQENSGWGTPDKVKALAKNIGGLNTAQFNQCLDSGKYKQEVQDETAAGKNYGVNGTPSVFVNGKIIVGAQPFDTLKQAIDAALK